MSHECSAFMTHEAALLWPQGYVEMAAGHYAADAIAGLDKKLLHGKKLRVFDPRQASLLCVMCVVGW